mmetsp:Transcript_112809/g.319101  ORF Transcript_112809/g.319101 Transcript_112809/m.319101 type:complete len:228 (-) Transcript_112809:186-869(-)
MRDADCLSAPTDVSFIMAFSTYRLMSCWRRSSMIVRPSATSRESAAICSSTVRLFLPGACRAPGVAISISVSAASGCALVLRPSKRHKLSPGRLSVLPPAAVRAAAAAAMAARASWFRALSFSSVLCNWHALSRALSRSRATPASLEPSSRTRCMSWRTSAKGPSSAHAVATRRALQSDLAFEAGESGRRSRQEGLGPPLGEAGSSRLCKNSSNAGAVSSSLVPVAG